MGNELRFDGRVAIITGAGNGLGRSHALLLASRGCKVVVNDLGGGIHGDGKSATAADKVVAEIKAAGGEAVANANSVEDGAEIVKTALDTWGRLDIVINNAGILRDTSFHKMAQADWDLIYKVHVLGSFRVTHAAWEHMRERGYGRVIFTASAAGIYGNFGQANYSMAKLGLLGLSNTLAIEGQKKGILVNTIAPIAGSRLTETVLPPDLIAALKPEYVSPLVAYLCHESSTETGGLYEVGGGFMGKLRWERTRGHTFLSGKPITPDTVLAQWGAITSFKDSTNPGDINGSMAPIIAALNQKSKGGNALIDLDQALGYTFPEATSRYDERDLALYALGVGAASDPTDDKELQLVYENHGAGFRALPTFGVVPALGIFFEQAKKGVSAPGLNYGFERILHGEQYIELKRPLPATATTLKHTVRIKDIFDKGKNASVVMEVLSYDEAGREIMRNEITQIVRGAGGWGGDRGPAGEANEPPARAPDATVTEKIGANQALLYRLSGDINPLHVDPGFATSFGFSKPILHGLCTFGYVARHVLKSFAGGETRLFKSMKVRFADSVFPGETLTTEMWKESPTRIVFRTKVNERDKVVISHAAIELFDKIPTEQPAQAATATASAPAQAAKPTSAAVFAIMQKELAEHPDIAKQVGTVFQFVLSDPASTWALDLKNGAGSLTQGNADKPDVSLALADADFMSLALGEADPQKLYFGGKLKISGNVMASQKLAPFFKSVDAKTIKAQLQNAATAAPAAAAPAAAPSASKPAQGPALFAKLKDQLAKNPSLAKEVGAVLQFRVTEPDGVWTVDLANGAPSVKEGAHGTASTIFTLKDEALAQLLTAARTPQDLYQHGELRVDGDLGNAHKLKVLRVQG